MHVHASGYLGGFLDVIHRPYPYPVCYVPYPKILIASHVLNVDIGNDTLCCEWGLIPFYTCILRNIDYLFYNVKLSCLHP